MEKTLLNCYNRGCGQTFDPEKNTDESCRHHPGEPYFHDAYKGWSCCNKKSVDFTEFLNIKGCTLSKHSNIKPPEPEKPKKDESIDKEVIEVRAPIRVAMERPPISTAMIKLKPTISQSLKDAVDSIVSKAPTTAVKTLEDGEIAIGTACKNNGCKYSYSGTNKDAELCQHHPGVPIFHEGMKYWSCCQKKTSDFAVFMDQKGCVDGVHKWVKKNNDQTGVQCRYDWHQTAADVIVSIYAKLYSYVESKVEVNPIRLHVNLVFPDQNNAKFDLDIELRGIIDVNLTSVQMYGSKVEITMRKAEPGSWQKLEFSKITQTTLKSNSKENQKKENESSDDDIDLDDVETIKPGGLKITEIGSSLNSVD